MKLRFFAEEGARVCVWGEEEDADQTQHRLPIPPDLVAEMDAWITEFNERTQQHQPGPWTAQLREAHDRRGYELSRRLQEALGTDYEVEYRFATSAVRRSVHVNGAPSVPNPQPARLVELLRAVAVLALPAAEQLGWAAARGGRTSPDPLVLDLYETADQVSSFRDAGWISARAAERIDALEHAVENLSGPGNAEVWSATALREAPEWDRIRDLARGVLADL